MNHASASSPGPREIGGSPDAELAGEERPGVLAACLGAGLALTGYEVLRWLGLRNYHPVDYYLLTAGLALGASLLLGLVTRILGLGRAAALGLWAAGTVALVRDPMAGVMAGGATYMALRLAAREQALRPGAFLQGASVGAVASLVLLKGDWLGHLFDFLSSPTAVAVLDAVYMLVFLFVLPRLVVRFGGPLRSSAWALVPMLLAAWFALEPWTHRVSGVHRRPPPNFQSHRELPDQGQKRPDVLLIVLDTLRADRLSVYGYGRETTPELERLLEERDNAVAFPAAYSNGTWTVPSHASLFTGQLPNVHGAHFDLDGSLRTRFGMHEGTPHLAALLQEQGYATLGAYANHWLRVVGGMNTGFDVFFRVISFERLPFLGEALRAALVPGLCLDATKGGARGAMVNRSILDLVRSWDSGVEHPLFLFANYGDTHGPYAPPVPFRGKFYPTSLRERAQHLALDQSEDERERLSGRYDEELLYLDKQLGDLFDQLDEIGFLDGAWVFITSDHGEAFGEHGITEHGTTVHQEVVRVPLLVFPPAGVRLERVDAPVSLVDVSATIAAIAGTRIEGSPGRDLRGLRPETAIASVEFYGDAAKADIHGEAAGLPQRTILSGYWKLVEVGFAPDTELMLFNLSVDPGEEHNLAAENLDLVEELRSQLPPYGEPARGRINVDQETEQHLEDMGYGGSARDAGHRP